MKKLWMAGAIVLMAGCASLSEKECLTVDWADQGYRDGRAGQPPSRIEDHRDACAKMGIIPDTERYRVGRDDGVLEYCSPANAVHEGRLGRSYRNACPVQLEGTFLAYHRLGYRAYEAEQRLESLDRQMQRTQRDLEKEKNESKRRELRNELRDLDRRLHRARSDLRDDEMRLHF